MANASKKNMGKPDKGKGSGSGAQTELQEGVLGENEVLSTETRLSIPTRAVWTRGQ